MVSGRFRNGAMGDVVPHGSKVMRFLSLDSFLAEKKGIKINRGATRGLPGRSPILVLLSPKHAKLRSSDGIQCISAARLRVKKAEFVPEKLTSLSTALYGFWAFPKWCYG
uniref:Uncharacterized protein n=1 Tax=Brassica oleracea var. oleracea TaxID=109376 RepID=A0A0D2ZY12_BRAOL